MGDRPTEVYPRVGVVVPPVEALLAPGELLARLGVLAPLRVGVQWDVEFGVTPEDGQWWCCTPCDSVPCRCVVFSVFAAVFNGGDRVAGVRRPEVAHVPRGVEPARSAVRAPAPLRDENLRGAGVGGRGVRRKSGRGGELSRVSTGRCFGAGWWVIEVASGAGTDALVQIFDGVAAALGHR